MPLLETKGAASAQGFGFTLQRAGAVQAEAIDYDGTNDTLSRTSDLVGNTDGKTFTFSAWVWVDTTGSRQILTAGFVPINFFVSANIFSIFLDSTSGGTRSITMQTNTAQIPLNTFVHILYSADVSNSSLRSLYINDVLVSGVTYTDYNNINIDWTQTAWSVGGATQFWDGRLSNVYLDKTYRDLSITANRRLFVTADLKPAAGQAALNPILYLPLSDPTAPGLNTGTGGNFTLTGVVARSGRGPNQYNAPYSDLDGSADYLSRTTAPTGIADGKQLTVSGVFNFDSTAGRILVFSQSTNYKVEFALVGGKLTIECKNAAGSTVLSVTANQTLVANRNYQFVLSCDMTDSAKRWLKINGEDLTNVWSTYVNDNINFSISSTPRYLVGATSALAATFNGRLGALWFNTSYIDLSVPANLAKFVSGTGINAAPVDLGATGELPTGTSPLIYLPMYGNDAGRNYGTGGDFTVNSGPYTGARGPNEYWASAVGNSGYLYRDTPLSGATNTKTLTFFALFKPTSTAVVRSIWQINGVGGGALVGQIQVKGGDDFGVFFNNAAGVTVLNATVTSPLISSTSQTYAIHCSVDLSDSTKRSIYINGVAATVTWSTYTNDTMNFSAQRSGIGAEWGASWNGALLRGNLGSLYITNTYVDFKQEANRLLFADAFNYSTDIGAAITAGTIPNPLIFMKFDPANNGVNFGTGGNYTNASMSDGGQL